MNSKSVSVYEFDFLNSLQNLFSVKFKITESLKLSYINFVKYLNICLYCIFFLLGFTPCKAEQSLQGMESQEKETQKD